MEQLTALVLAGGLGKRLGPATDKCPKVLLGINGRPFLM
jgi:NDP-sugar pyrophosphorylase family protein